jgi:RimJ/RimL family protein N-acetyltransferase
MWQSVAMDPHVRIVAPTAPTFRALAAGDVAAAGTTSPVTLSAFLAGPDLASTWLLRAQQVEADPAAGGWVTGVIWDEGRQVAVGLAGYHAPPDPSGMVEVGYEIDPAYRRQAYARAALKLMLARAAREPEVRTVRASISPDNTVSAHLVARCGFVDVGEQWDEEDGLEIVYEVAAS